MNGIEMLCDCGEEVISKGKCKTCYNANYHITHRVEGNQRARERGKRLSLLVQNRTEILKDLPVDELISIIETNSSDTEMINNGINKV